MILSICVPTYNRAFYLEKLLCNIVKQQQKNIQICIVNDGSTDHTKVIVEKYKSKLSILAKHQTNSGRASALRKAISIATGDFLLVMDDEDEFVDNALFRINEYLQNINSYNSKRPIIGFTFLTSGISGKIIGSSFKESPLITNLVKINADYKAKGDKKQVIQSKYVKEVLYDIPENERRVPTYTIWSRLAVKYDVVFLNEVVVVKEYLSSGLTHKINKLRRESAYSSRRLYKEISEMDSRIYNSILYRLKNVVLFHKYNFYCSAKQVCKVSFFMNLVGFVLGGLLYLKENYST